MSTAQRVWTPAYVGIGSNLDEPLRQVERAFTALATLPASRLVARSRIYRSRPLGPQDQPDFLNAAAGILTQLGPLALLESLQSLERSLGRATPVVRWGPRRIDLDLLAYGRVEMATERLVLPHPGLCERAFVLYPLADFAPDLDVPGCGFVRDLAARIPPDGIAAIEHP
jgi:2-amino-4-hydroxy-6-hydroxymethyldihydropteridine diphosphokinase